MYHVYKYKLLFKRTKVNFCINYRASTLRMKIVSNIYLNKTKTVRKFKISKKDTKEIKLC